MLYYIILFICLSIMFHRCSKMSEHVTQYLLCFCSGLFSLCASFHDLVFVTLCVPNASSPPSVSFSFFPPTVSLSICICCLPPPHPLCNSVKVVQIGKQIRERQRKNKQNYKCDITPVSPMVMETFYINSYCWTSTSLTLTASTRSGKSWRI